MIRSSKSCLGEVLHPRSQPLSSLLEGKAPHAMIDFIGKCLALEPEDRMTPQAALHHAWLIEI
jgi:serine/threonine protein kinase